MSYFLSREELFYQLGLRQFGNYARIKLEPQPPIRHLIQLAVRTEENRWKKCGLDLEEDEVVNVRSFPSFFK